MTENVTFQVNKVDSKGLPVKPYLVVQIGDSEFVGVDLILKYAHKIKPKDFPSDRIEFKGLVS